MHIMHLIQCIPSLSLQFLCVSLTFPSQLHVLPVFKFLIPTEAIYAAIYECAWVWDHLLEHG